MLNQNKIKINEKIKNNKVNNDEKDILKVKSFNISFNSIKFKLKNILFQLNTLLYSFITNDINVGRFTENVNKLLLEKEEIIKNLNNYIRIMSNNKEVLFILENETDILKLDKKINGLKKQINIILKNYKKL